MTKIVDTLSQLLKRTLLSTFSSIYHTILLNRIRWLVASWSILLYLRFDCNGSLSRYDVQKTSKHRGLPSVHALWCRNFGPAGPFWKWWAAVRFKYFRMVQLRSDVFWFCLFIMLLDRSTIQSKRYWRLLPNNYDLSGRNTPCRGFRIPVTDSSFCEWSLDSGFWSSVAGIPSSLSCIADSKAQESWFHIQKFLGFGNPHSLTWSE